MHPSLQAHTKVDPTFDPNNITISNVTTVYDNTNTLMPSQKIGPISMTIEPSQVIALTAAHGVGKSTFLKLIGRILLPTEGFVSYPANLRTRFVGDKPMLFNRSLLFNLTFGNHHCAITVPSRYQRCTITVPSSYHHRTVTVPSPYHNPPSAQQVATEP